MRLKAFLFVSIVFLFACQNKRAHTSFDLDPKIEQSIDSLISLMSIEEKVGQTCQITLDAVLKRDDKGVPLEPNEIDTFKLNEAIVDYNIGSMLNVSSHTLGLEEWHRIVNSVHQTSLKSSHQIPIIYGVDAIHGANYIKNSTLFPQEIALAASWDTSLAYVLGEVTAYETRASGVPWNFSPVLDLGRQPLWSRYFETLGEDPYLIKMMGKSIVEGYQGKGKIDEYHVAACLKHFVGYGTPTSGRDRTPALIPQRSMEEYHLPSFKESIDAGALTVMINSGEVNGIPGHTNRYLLTDVLKEKWGFAGFSVSDWEDFIKLHKEHKTDSTIKEGIASAINAGVDMSMVPNSPDFKTYFKLFVELVNEGRISMNRLDDAVRRILRVKHHLSLFEKAPFSEDTDYSKFGSEEHRQASYQAAAESITLLKNKEAILPLSKDQSVLLIGPTANNLNFLNGAWTHTWQGTDSQYNHNVPTIKEAMESKFDKVTYFEGSKLLMIDGDEADVPSDDLQKAVRQAYQSDVAIVCVGEMPSTERPGDIYTLDLPLEQQNIVKSLSKTGIPIVLVLVEGRPKIIREIEPLSNAIIQAYLPGDMGGLAIADILCGEVNPSGKLPYTYPRHNGVIMHYDHKYSELINGNTWKNDFFNPQFEFGHGLSYTTFEYSNLTLSHQSISSNEQLKVSVDITNKGQRKGKEVVQLYLSDHYASITPSVKKLKRFSKVELDPSSNTTVEFYLNLEDLKFFGKDNQWVAEEGKFTISIGNLSKEFNYQN